jgi:hypothetical protein
MNSIEETTAMAIFPPAVSNSTEDTLAYEVGAINCRFLFAVW